MTLPDEKKYRLLLAIGNDEIEERIEALPDVTVIDSDSDLEIITDILNYETVDFVIMNTVLSEEKSVMLAKKAKEKSVKVIALVESQKNKEWIATLVGFGVRAFVALDGLQLLPVYIKEYPEEFDFRKLQKASSSGPELCEGSPLSTNHPGKIFIGVFNICSGAGATTTLVELAENIAISGYSVICISPGGSSDFQFINRKKCKAEYVITREEAFVKDLDRIYSETSHNVILFDFGKVFDIDAAGNLNGVLPGKEIYREFLRCRTKVGLAFSDPWHEGKLKFFREQQLGGELTILISGFGVMDAVKAYPELNLHDRDELAAFVDELKARLGMKRSGGRKRWISRMRLKRKSGLGMIEDKER